MAAIGPYSASLDFRYWAVELTLLGITTVGIADTVANLRAMNRGGKRLGCELR